MQFDFQLTTHVFFGQNRIADIGSISAQFGARHILLVTDPGIVATGHVERTVASLQRTSLTVDVFQDIQENPTARHVESGVRFAQEAGNIDFIIGLGGGSAMDCAKGINFLLTNGGKMEDYWGVGKVKKPMLPSIGIPTTAGTGSEAQSFALISQENTHIKMACGDKKALFRAVILDPLLVQSVPKNVAAASGLDAIAHALESYVSKEHTPFSQMLSREAWRLLERNFETIHSNPADITAWGNMQLGAHYAGAAIENSMLGAAHACANPLTAKYGITHGLAVAMMLPQVMRFNNEIASESYQELLKVTGLTNGHIDDSASHLIKRFSEMQNAACAPGKLSDFGVTEESLPALAEAAA
ncbi:MAG: iron-containing alcohol dehydrogenase, partial [bacterium]